jgi:hypothetical protein
MVKQAVNRLIISSPFKKKTGLICASQSHYDATVPFTLFLRYPHR